MLLAIALVVSIHATPSIPHAVVTRALAETDAIWRAAGVVIDWRFDEQRRGQLHVLIGDEHGRGEADAMPIGWIGFLTSGAPDDEIHLSRANALALLYKSDHLRYRDLPPMASDASVGRALGRALAHELGHWLFRSKEHERRGLMATRRTPDELFGIERGHFLLTHVEQARAALALHGASVGERRTAQGQ